VHGDVYESLFWYAVEEGVKLMSELKIPIEIDSYRPLREIVFEALRNAIIERRLEPGDRLMEVQLAEAMGVSRTPVREAIRRLELEGFVVMIPRRGAYVAQLSLKDIADAFEIRGALEGLAAGLAAERATDEEIEQLERVIARTSDCLDKGDADKAVELDIEFHEVIYEASRNQRLTQIISNLREQILRFRTQSLAYPGRLAIAVHEHVQIVDAIAERDPGAARKRAEEHIEAARNALMKLMSEQRRGKKKTSESSSATSETSG
jgi:DNA-binding GntR family transcriptional regulator